jgi:hypothetical protein
MVGEGRGSGFIRVILIRNFHARTTPDDDDNKIGKSNKEPVVYRFPIRMPASVGAGLCGRI